MVEKIVISCLDDFRKWSGCHLFTSEPIEVSKARIQQFCRSVDNDEWIHWDEERCREAGFDGVIMPAFMGPALMSKAYFQYVEFKGVEGLFSGVNRLRLLKPVHAGEAVYQRWLVGEVTERKRGISVIYHVQWFVDGGPDPVIVAEYVLRYW